MAKIQMYSAAQFLETMQKHSGLELVHFASPLFTGCKYVSRQLKNLVREFAELLTVSEVTIELQQTDLIRAYHIEQLPTVLLLDRGEEVERLEEILPPETFREFLRDCVSFYLPAGGYPESQKD